MMALAGFESTFSPIYYYFFLPVYCLALFAVAAWVFHLVRRRRSRITSVIACSAVLILGGAINFLVFLLCLGLIGLAVALGKYCFSPA